MLQQGDRAPDFRIGESSLHEWLKDRSVVVFFYPKAFTPGWTKEAGGFRREYENLRHSGCDVVGVSHDDQATNDRFRESLGLPYPLVGDPEGRVTAAYDVKWPVFGRVQRVTYVISRAAEIRLAFHSELSPGRHVSEACAAANGAAPQL